MRAWARERWNCSTIDLGVEMKLDLPGRLGQEADLLHDAVHGASLVYQDELDLAEAGLLA